MKLAIVHPYPVHAGAVGGTTRVYAWVRHFAAASHAVTVLAHTSGNPEVDARAVEELKALGVVQKLFPLTRPPLASRLRWAVGATPYFVQRNRNPGLEQTLAALDVDAVHVEHGYLAPLLEGLPASVVRSLAEQETMSVAIGRLWQGSGLNPYEWYLLTQQSKVLAFERRNLSRFDRLWAIHRAEAQHLSRELKREVAVLPHVVDARAFAPRDRAFEKPRVLFVGNYAHRPNWHGLRWLLKRVWPQVLAEVPLATLELAGPGLEGKRRGWVERLGGQVLGRVDDLAAAYRACAVFVNPIQTGGGMRGKVLEAFACACPVVSTTLGMEGIDARDGQQCLLADAPSAFAAAVVRCLREPALAREHGRWARALAEREYDSHAVFQRLEAELLDAVGTRRRAMA